MKKKIRSSLHMVMYIVVVWVSTYLVINYVLPRLLHLPIYDEDGMVIGQHMVVGIKIMDGYGVTDTEFTRYVEKALKWKYGEEFVVTQYATGGYGMECGGLSSRKFRYTGYRLGGIRVLPLCGFLLCSA